MHTHGGCIVAALAMNSRQVHPMNLGSVQWATITVTGFSGYVGAGFYRLVVNTSFPMPRRTDEARTILEMGGGFFLRRRQGGNLPLGTLTPFDHPLLIENNTNESPYDPSPLFFVDLDRQRLEAIEDLRAGGDLPLEMFFWCRGHSSTRGFLAGKANFSVDVPQSSWVQVLEQLQYRRYLLLEVPLPGETGPPALAGAARSLSAAMSRLAVGDDRGAVAACRESIDGLEEFLGDKASRPGGIDALFENARKWTKAERMLALRRALHALASPSHHGDAVSREVDWDRSDAVAIVASVASLLSRVMKKPGG
jgi:hypothetical protein